MEKKNEIEDYQLKIIKEELRLSKKSDNLYYNVTVANNTDDQFLRASFKDDRIIAILKKPDDYYASIIRFKIPITSIPLMIFRDNFYHIRLSFGGVNYDSYVTYISRGPGVLTIANTIFTLQHFLDCVNQTFNTLYLAVVAANPANPAVPAGYPPIIIFNSTTQLFTLRCLTAFANANMYASPPPAYDPPNPAVLNIYFNYNLADLFYLQSYDVSILPPAPQSLTSSLLIVKDNGNNLITIGVNNYYDMTQESPTQNLFIGMQSITFISNSLGTKSEALPNLDGADDQLSIIADFEPFFQQSIDHGYIQFFQSGPYKYMDFDTNQEIRNIKIDAYWVNNYRLASSGSQLVPIYLTPGQSFTMKIMFKKKSLVDGGK